MELNSSGGDTPGQIPCKAFPSRDDNTASTVPSTISLKESSQYSSLSCVHLSELRDGQMANSHKTDDGRKGNHVFQDYIFKMANDKSSTTIPIKCPLEDQWSNRHESHDLGKNDGLPHDKHSCDIKWLRGKYQEATIIKPYTSHYGRCCKRPRQMEPPKQLQDDNGNCCYIVRKGEKLPHKKRSSKTRLNAPASKQELLVKMTKLDVLGRSSEYNKPSTKCTDMTVNTESIEDIRSSLCSLQHKNLVKVIDLCLQNTNVRSQTSVSGQKGGAFMKTDPNSVTDIEVPRLRLVLVSEYCHNIGTLDQLVKAKNPSILPELVSRYYFAQMVSAVKYLHDQGVVHRNLNCKNILLSLSNEVKIVGLETARRHEDAYGVFWEISNDISYRCPQMIKYDVYNPRGADVWALGIILFRTMFGRLPFFIHYRLHSDSRKSHNLSETHDSKIGGSDEIGSQSFCENENLKELILEVNEREMGKKLKFPPDIQVSSTLKELLIGVLQMEEHCRSSINKVSQEEWFLVESKHPLIYGSEQQTNMLDPASGIEFLLRKNISNPRPPQVLKDKESFAIGNYHLVRQPIKITTSLEEIDHKKGWYI